MSNAQRFLTLFNDIENYLTNLAGLNKHEDFMRIVVRLCEKNKVIRAYKDDLREYSELRNAIVHQQKAKPIAEPYDETVEDLGKIIALIKKPPTAYAIASKPVYKCKADELIVDVVKKMTKEVYTHVPVLENGNFVGVFSESALARWLGSSSEKDGFILEAARIGEIKQYFDKENDPFCCYKFVSRNTDMFTIKDDFLAFVNQTKRLGAVFVTANGKKEEDVLGIITPWDLPKLNDRR
jgi:predicted transcriptional regulator